MARAVQSVDRRMDRTRGGGRAPVLPLEKPAAGRMLQESPQLGVLSQPGALEGLPPTLFYLPGTPGHVCPSLDRAQGLGRGCDSSQAVGPGHGLQTVPSGITGGWRKREVDQAPWADRPPGLWHQVGTRVHGGAGAAWAHPGCSSLVAKAFAGDPGFEGRVWGQACGSGVPSGGGAADSGARAVGPSERTQQGMRAGGLLSRGGGWL